MCGADGAQSGLVEHTTGVSRARTVREAWHEPVCAVSECEERRRGSQMLQASSSTAAIPSAITANAMESYSSQISMMPSNLPIVGTMATHVFAGKIIH